MRSSSVLSVLLAGLTLSVAACELQPAPKTQPPVVTAGSADAPAAAAAAAAPAPPVPPAPSVDAGVAGPTDECLQISDHIAEVLIREATDPAQKAGLVQDRTKIVRRSAEGCTRDAWPAAAKTCFLTANTVAALQECGKDLKAPE